MSKKNSSNKGCIIAVIVVGILFLLSFLRRIFKENPAIGGIVLIGIVVVASLIYYFKQKKLNEAEEEEETPPQTITYTIDGEKDFSKMPDVEDDEILKYQYENDLFIPPEVDASIMKLSGGTALELRPEPENEHDEKAVAVYLKGSKLGYVYRGQTQDMIHDWLRRGDHIKIYLNKFSISERKATYKIGFYKPLESFKNKTFSVSKISKKAEDEYSTSRYDALSTTEVGEMLTVDDNLDGTYTLSNECGEEIGCLSKGGAAFIDDNDAKRVIAFLEEKDDFEGTAKVRLYLI